MHKRESEFRTLNPHLLLDTHVLIYWLGEPKKLSREQNRVLTEASRRGQPFALSGISLMEIAVIPVGRFRSSIPEILAALEPGLGFHIIPIDLEVAAEVTAMGDSLRDPMDRVIVATARIHGLRLVTSDRRIIASRLVPVVE